MTKFYFSKDAKGKKTLYHRAPGLDEMHVPAGDDPEEYRHLIPNEEMAQGRSEFWDNDLGKALGGNKYSAAFRVGALVWMIVTAPIWTDVAGLVRAVKMIPEVAQGQKDFYEFRDSTRMVFKREEKDREERDNVTLPLVYRDHQILKQHFPEDVRRSERAWGAGMIPESARRNLEFHGSATSYGRQ